MNFDEKVNMRASIGDLKHPIIRNYLSYLDNELFELSSNMTIEELGKQMKILSTECYKPLNVGLLFFNDNPEQFFPYSRIEVVNIPDPTGQGMEERIFKGPIDLQLKDALTYIRNNVIAEKVFKVSGEAKAVRVFNYSYEAIEEFLSNAIYHKSYQIHEPVTVRIEKELIEITSLPGPDRSISDEDIKNYQMRTRRYRNRRIGDFLKELHLIEGRNTGIPTALRAIKENGSPLPEFITDEDRTFFTVVIPIHEAFKEEQVNKKKPGNRRNREEITRLIISSLMGRDKSLRGLYSDLGYSGSPSSSFANIINSLIKENIIVYRKNSNKTLLHLNDE